MKKKNDDYWKATYIDTIRQYYTIDQQRHVRLLRRLEAMNKIFSKTFSRTSSRIPIAGRDAWTGRYIA